MVTAEITPAIGTSSVGGGFSPRAAPPSSLARGRIAGASAVAQSTTGGTLDQAVEDLVVANRVLAREGIVDGYGHVSARHPASLNTFLLARSIAPELVTRDDVMEYDLEGRPLDARGRASYQERFIHSEIYKARPDVRAIVHCHTPSLIPFCNSTVPLRPMFHMSFFVAEGIPVFEIRTAAGMTDLLVKDAVLGRALAEALGRKPAALMRGHGAVVVADSIPTVVGRSVYLDLECAHADAGHRARRQHHLCGSRRGPAARRAQSRTIDPGSCGSGR